MSEVVKWLNKLFEPEYQSAPCDICGRPLLEYPYCLCHMNVDQREDYYRHIAACDARDKWRT